MDRKDTISNEKDIEGTLYQIRVKGNLDPKWADWFEGLVLTSPGDGATILSGRVADQAALHGILNKVNRLGLLLILVAQVGDGKRCPLCGQDRRDPLTHTYARQLQRPRSVE